ncbi:hypothetical protein [Cyclobacterium roseum]|uniref:hypothetical protein n=1 Tax=Cyclobacterium roseum TaxID=2666137 RepID=UPI001390C938|nr:hypothetical protein [Cyclobacterium roseum]
MILITGPTGFVGQNLQKHLKARPWKALSRIVVVRPATIQFGSNRGGYVRYVLGFRVWPFCIWGCFWDLGAVVMLVPGMPPPPVLGGGPGGGHKRARALAASWLHY